MFESTTNPVTNSAHHPSLSKNYKHINTESLKEFVEGMGYTLFKSVVTKPRKADRQGFQKHMLIFDHPSLDLKDEKIQLMLINSHDGSTSLRIMLGVYRLVCSNGLIVGKTLDERRVNHKGTDFLPKVYAGIESVVKQAEILKSTISLMKNKKVDESNRWRFFYDIAAHRIGRTPDGLDLASFTPQRDADKGDDLFKLFNVGQERVVNGGIRFINEGKHRVTRKIKGIDSLVEQNKYVWDRAVELLVA